MTTLWTDVCPPKLPPTSRGACCAQLDTRTPLAVTVGANALHLALVPALVWGAGWGVGGAAAATAVAEWAAAAAYLTFLWRCRDTLGEASPFTYSRALWLVPQLGPAVQFQPRCTIYDCICPLAWRRSLLSA